LLERDDADRMPQIIFATAFDQYARARFRVNAIDYYSKRLTVLAYCKPSNALASVCRRRIN